jgi:hypothetical protein
MADANIESKRTLLRTQVESLLKTINHLEDSERAPPQVLPHLEGLFKEAKRIFDDDVAKFVVHPPSYGFAGGIRASATSLLSYLDHHLGDPIARSLVGDAIQNARWASKQGLPLCAVMLCRVAQEQTMKRLCERYSIQYPPGILPGALAQLLRKDKGGPLESHQLNDLESKITFEGQVLHDRTQPTQEDVAELIEWTERFVDRWLRRGT